MTKYLISLGHKRIGFLADNLVGVDNYRFKGYRKALEDEQIPFYENNFILIEPGRDEIKENLLKICNLHKEYTVFFVVSDYYAVMLSNELRDKGVRIPEDISIVGYDNNDCGKMMRPRLTTVNQDITLKGETAVAILLKLLNGEKVEKHNNILPTKLIIRDTVKNIT